MKRFQVIHGIQGDKNFYKTYLFAENNEDALRLINKHFNGVYGATIESTNFYHDDNFIERVVATTLFPSRL